MEPSKLRTKAKDLSNRIVGKVLKVAEDHGGSQAALLRAAGLGHSFFRDLRGRSKGIQLTNLLALLLSLEIEPSSFLRDALGDLEEKEKEEAKKEKEKGSRPKCVERALEDRARISPRAEKEKRRFGL